MAKQVGMPVVTDVILSDEEKTVFNTVFDEVFDNYADMLESKAPESEFQIGDTVLVNFNKQDTWLGSAKELLDEIVAPYGTEFSITSSEYDINDFLADEIVEDLKNVLLPIYALNKEEADLLYKLEAAIKTYIKKNNIGMGWVYELKDNRGKVGIPADMLFPQEALILDKSKAGNLYKRLVSFLYEEKMLGERIKSLLHDADKVKKQLAELV